MFATLFVLEGRVNPGNKLESAFDVIGDEIDVLIDAEEDEIGVWFNSFGMSFSNLSIVLGGNGVVNPASLVDMSSADVDEGDDISDDLLLLRLSPVELPSKIMFRGGGWVRK